MTPRRHPTDHERALVRRAQKRYREMNAQQFASWLRGFAKVAHNSELLRWKFNKMLREKQA